MMKSSTNGEERSGSWWGRGEWVTVKIQLLLLILLRNISTFSLPQPCQVASAMNKRQYIYLSLIQTVNQSVVSDE